VIVIEKLAKLYTARRFSASCTLREAKPADYPANVNEVSHQPAQLSESSMDRVILKSPGASQDLLTRMKSTPKSTHQDFTRLGP